MNEEHSHHFACECREKRFEEIHVANQRLQKRVERLEKALKECKGLLWAHEAAIRQDSGNTNWECMMDKVIKALAGQSEDDK